MIRSKTLLTSRPIGLQHVAEYIGLADQANPVLLDVLEGVIDDVEKVLGAGIGRYRVTVEVPPPVPSVLLMPYSPIGQVSKVRICHLLTQQEQDLNVTPHWRQTVPDQLWLGESGSILVPPEYALVIEYEGGYEELPPDLRLTVLRNCLVRWENRQLRTLIDVVPVSDERYVAVWL